LSSIASFARQKKAVDKGRVADSVAIGVVDDINLTGFESATPHPARRLTAVKCDNRTIFLE